MQTSFGLRLLTALSALLTEHAAAADTQAWQAQLTKLYGPLATENHCVTKISDVLLNAALTENQLRGDVDLFDHQIVHEHEMQRIVSAGVRSARYGAQAVLFALGAQIESESVVYRELGRLVVKNVYPRWAAFYAAGAYGDFSVHRLPLAHYPAHLHIAGEQVEAQHAIWQGMKWTRNVIAQRTRERVQHNRNTALRDPTTGRPLKRFRKQHWQQLTWRLGYTTIFDMLREIANHGWDYQDLDGDKQQEFVRQLLRVVEQLNRASGQIVSTVLGASSYQKLHRFCALKQASAELLAHAA
jgi:peptidoglycan/xylan/chitin deacetylase (PgdA/CDA1 family)